MDYQTLADVNTEVNMNSQYKSDLENYKCGEYWEEGNYYKDCDDYALTKRRILLDKGMKLENVCIATCWCETGEYHAVLYVELDDGSYILDNRFQTPIFPKNLPYKWDKILKGNIWYAISGF